MLFWSKRLRRNNYSLILTDGLARNGQDPRSAKRQKISTLSSKNVLFEGTLTDCQTWKSPLYQTRKVRHHVKPPNPSYFQVYYELHNSFNVSIQRKFAEFEALFERVKNILPMDYDRPPKKKLLLSETKLAEKRRLWLEQFVNDVIEKHYEQWVFLRGEIGGWFLKREFREG